MLGSDPARSTTLVRPGTDVPNAWTEAPTGGCYPPLCYPHLTTFTDTGGPGALSRRRPHHLIRSQIAPSRPLGSSIDRTANDQTRSEENHTPPLGQHRETHVSRFFPPRAWEGRLLEARHGFFCRPLFISFWCFAMAIDDRLLQALQWLPSLQQSWKLTRTPESRGNVYLPGGLPSTSMIVSGSVNICTYVH